MTAEEKIRTYFYMQSRDAADRPLFDRLVDDEIVVIDGPVGMHTKGKEAVWASMNLPAEAKQGPDTFAFKADFIDYVGNEERGFARWWFQPTGKMGLLWGVTDVVLSAAQAPKIEIAIDVEFNNGKIARLNEYWDPVPFLQALGFAIPAPAMPQ